MDPELAASLRPRLPDLPSARLVVVGGPGIQALPRRAAPSRPPEDPSPGEAFPPARVLPAFVVSLLAVGAVGGFFLRPALVPSQQRATSVPAVPSTAPARSPDRLSTALSVGGAGPSSSGVGQPPTTRAPAPAPVRPAAAAPLAELVWPRAPGAIAYRVSLYRAGRLVYSTVRKSTRLRLARTWASAGKRQRLVAGTYRWVVWPLERRQGRTVRRAAIVDAKLEL